MAKQIDAMGKNCPIPVILVKKEIDAGEIVIVVKVDNEIAVENLKRLSDSCGYNLKTKEDGGCYELTMVKAGEEVNLSATNTQQPVKECSPECEEEGRKYFPQKSYAVFIGKEWIGDGDQELGKNLMRMFFYTLTQSDDLPDAVLFMNGGVRLPTLDEEVWEHLKTLEEKGVDVLVCGACLDFYGLKEELKAGKVSNMYNITERMQQADKVLTL